MSQRELLQLLHAPLADTLLVAEGLNVAEFGMYYKQVPRDCAAGAAGQPASGRLILPTRSLQHPRTGLVGSAQSRA